MSVLVTIMDLTGFPDEIIFINETKESVMQKLSPYQKEWLANIEDIEPTISPSMGVNTKPARRLKVNGYWILVDPTMPNLMYVEVYNKLTNDISRP